MSPAGLAIGIKAWLSRSGNIKALNANWNSAVKNERVIPLINAQIFQVQLDQATANNRAAHEATVVAQAQEKSEYLLRQRHHLQPGELDDFSIRNRQEIFGARESSSRIMALMLEAVASVVICYLAGWRSVIGPGVVLVAVFFSALVTVGFGNYPARKAAYLDPIEALRYE